MNSRRFSCAEAISELPPGTTRTTGLQSPHIHFHPLAFGRLSTPRWPRRWTTCSGAGSCSPASLGDGRICLTNNAAERALRGIALGRKSWLFAGSDRGGVRAAAMYTLIGTAKLNDVDPQAWLADVLGRIADTPQNQLDELLPWNWAPERKLDRAA